MKSLLLAATALFNAHYTTISGAARVVDGDTVIVAGTKVRLNGVDAAELGTARGENARRMMIALVTKELTCRVTGEKTWGREVGYCVTATGIDIIRRSSPQGLPWRVRAMTIATCDTNGRTRWQRSRGRPIARRAPDKRPRSGVCPG